MPRPRHRILFVEDEKNFREVIAYALREAGFEVDTASDGREALAALEGGRPRPEVILCDLTMPAMDGMEFLHALRGRGDSTPAIVLTAHGSIERAVEAMRAGAFDFVTKPVHRDALRMAIGRALEHQRLVGENRLLRERVAGGRESDRLLGSSPAMERLRATLLRLAESDAPVLLRGESGVGKELAARSLHFDGPRAQRGRFVVLNCAAIPGELLESELFGHSKGAFTSAIADREGRFEAADGGTLLLDEVGDMPLALQAKLLRALQEGEIERLGETVPRRVDVRIVAATNQPLEEKVAAGSFRQDLLFRLAVVPVVVPPLRERLEDLPALVAHFLAQYGAPGARVAPEAMELLRGHSWPGNVRELENVVRRACALHPGLKELSAEHIRLLPATELPPPGVDLLGDGPLRLPDGGLDFETIERRLLLAAWEQSGHNQTTGAKLLGLQRQAFIYRLQKFGIIAGYGRRRSEEEG